MKGGKLTRVIKIPLTAPINKPNNNVTTIVMGKLIPMINNFAIIIPAKPTIDPTERSIPAVAITKVIPSAIMRFIDACIRTFIRFSGTKK